MANGTQQVLAATACNEHNSHHNAGGHVIEYTPLLGNLSFEPVAR